MADLTVPLIILGVVLLVSFILLKMSIYVVKQAEGIVIERFGRFERILSSGIHFVVPFMDSPRPFTWKMTSIDPNGYIKAQDTVLYRIDLRESVFNFPIQEVYTRDTILLDVNSIMYYRIFDLKKAVYEVDDLNTALSNVAQTQLKEVFGNMTFTEALASQSTINDHMKMAFAERFSQWGVQVERMELLDMMPKQGTTISNAMKRQMIAERTRRAEFIIAEGEKSAMRLISEGTKLEKYNTGVAEQEATRKKSEGAAGATVELARAESKSLELIAAAFKMDGASQSEYMIAQRYMELIKAVAINCSTQRIYLPYESTALSGVIGNLKNIYGRNAKPSHTPAPRAAANRYEYDDLN